MGRKRLVAPPAAAARLATRRELLRRPDHATLDLRGLQAAIAGDRLLLGEPAGIAAPAVLRALRRLGY